MLPRSTATFRPVLAAAACATFLPPTLLGTAQAQDPPFVTLHGTLRDFQADHPDFGLTAAGIEGHSAGNVVLSLGADRRPDYAGTGFMVDSQWRDKNGANISPYLFVGGGWGAPGDVLVVDSAAVVNQSSADTYDSSVGPYGGSNRGPAPNFVTGSAMPTLSEPTGLPPLVDTVNFNGSGGTISSDLHCNKFGVKECTVRISGHVTMLVEDEFKVYTQAQLRVDPGSSLTLYVKKKCSVYDESSAGAATSADPEAFTIYNLGTDDILIKDQSSKVYADIISPDAALVVEDQAAYYGAFMGYALLVSDQSKAHFDTSAGGGGASDACGNAIADVAGAAGSASTGLVDSAATFDEWFRHVLGENLAWFHEITLIRNGSGVYEYLDDSFFPLDNVLYGNEGEDHNYNFTFTTEADCTYNQCTGQFFELQGADDLWLFIGEDLVIDLGGLQSLTSQRVDLDRLGLTDGETYRVRIFYAQRQNVLSSFRFRTNVALGAVTNRAVTAPVD